MNIKNLIIGGLKSNMAQLEKCRYIYIELLKILEFNTNTMYNTQKELYEQIYNRDYNIENISDLKVTCSNWALIFKKLLDEIKIPAIIKFNDYLHSWVEFKIDGETVYADATEGVCTDLARVKMNRLPLNFYFINDGKKVNYDFSKIDEKLGYNKKVSQANEELLQLKLNIDNKNIFYKIEYIFKHLALKKFGFFEGNEYIRYVVTYCLSEEELKKFKAITLSKTINNGIVESIKCLTISDSNIVKYYVYFPHKGIFEVSKEDIEKLYQMGYGVEGDKIIIGMTKISNFIIYRNIKNDNIRLRKEQLYTRKYASELDFLKKSI